MEIERNHPLRRLFAGLVQRRFFEDVRVRDARVAGYVSGLLTDFTHQDNLCRIRNARGKRLDDVGEMLIESNPMLDASSFDRERAVRKHIGDYTLFLIGMFPRVRHQLPAALEAGSGRVCGLRQSRQGVLHYRLLLRPV